MAEAKVGLVRAFVRRCGAYLALAALTLQLVLSFAHFHVHDVAFSKLDHSKIAAASVKHAWLRLEASQQFPSGLADDDEHCTICFSSFLLSNSSIPDAPRHPVLVEFGDVDLSFNFVFDTIFESRRAPFFSRAPPIG